MQSDFLPSVGANVLESPMQRNGLHSLWICDTGAESDIIWSQTSEDLNGNVSTWNTVDPRNLSSMFLDQSASISSRLRSWIALRVLWSQVIVSSKSQLFADNQGRRSRAWTYGLPYLPSERSPCHRSKSIRGNVGSSMLLSLIPS